MQRFEEEIRREHPDWFAEKDNPNTAKVIRHRVIKKIKIRQPMYILPVMLTMLLLGVYAGLLHVKHKKMQWHNEILMAHLEGQVLTTNYQVEKNRDAVNLIAILHNENFASVRKATGNEQLIFINQDWTIDNMPKHLLLSQKDMDRIKSKWLRAEKKAEEKEPTATLQIEEK